MLQHHCKGQIYRKQNEDKIKKGMEKKERDRKKIVIIKKSNI